LTFSFSLNVEAKSKAIYLTSSSSGNNNNTSSGGGSRSSPLNVSPLPFMLLLEQLAS